MASKIAIVPKIFDKFFCEGTELQRDGLQFDRLFERGDTSEPGNIRAFVMVEAGPDVCLNGTCDGRYASLA